MVQEIVNEGGQRHVTLNTQQLKDMYERIKGDPRLTARNPATGRKMSLRELEAKIRQMELQDQVDDLQKRIKEEEDAYREIVDHWKSLPKIPGEHDIAAAFEYQEFQPTIAPPSPYDARREQEILMRGIVTRIKNASFLSAMFADQKAKKLFPAEWAKKESELRAAYQRKFDAYQVELARQQECWQKEEDERIGRLQILMNRDLSEIHKAATEIIQAIQFPFETTCDIYIDDNATLYVHLDLPEIEDTIPTHKKTVLKKGVVKEAAIDEIDRNKDYYHLVVGQGVYVATTLCSAVPSVPSVRIAAFTQRGGGQGEGCADTYVYDIEYPRDKLAAFNPDETPLQFFVMGLKPGMEVDERFFLDAIPPPEWTRQIRPEQEATASTGEDGGS